MRLRIINPLYSGSCATPKCVAFWGPSQTQRIGYNPNGPKGLKCYCLSCAELINNGRMNMGDQRPSDAPQTQAQTRPTSSAASQAFEFKAPTNAPEPENTPEAEFARNDDAADAAAEFDNPTPDTTDPLPSDTKRDHKYFAVLLAIMGARDLHECLLNVWIAGPAGSGKTTAFKKAATVRGLKYAFCGALTQTYVLFGYKDANGTYHRTPFREIWEFGGAFLLDDFDASDPAVAVELNALLANGEAAFPDGMVPRHPDCFIGLSANTWGHGATSDYVGRAKQDGAFMDRFVRLPWDYDEDLERALAPEQPAWVKRVQEVRANVRAKGLKVLVTPRATVYGAALLNAGLPQADVERLTIAAPMTPEQWQSVRGAA